MPAAASCNRDRHTNPVGVCLRWCHRLLTAFVAPPHRPWALAGCVVTVAAMAALLTMQEPAAQGLDTLPQRRRWAARLVYTDLRLLGEAAQEAILLHVHWGLLLSTLLLAQAVTAAVTPLLLLVQLLLLARRG